MSKVITLTVGDGEAQGQKLPHPGVPCNTLTIANSYDDTVRVLCPGRRLFGEEQDIVDKQFLAACPANETVTVPIRPPIRTGDELYVNYAGSETADDVVFTFSNIDLEKMWQQHQTANV